MAVTIGTNIASLAAQRRLAVGTADLSQSMERLASGLRITRASDDAAGLSIASLLNVDSRVYTQAVRNVNDGVSSLSIAEGAVQSLSQITERQMELAEQAANGTLSWTQRKALNAEANSLASEYNRIVQTVNFNGRSLINVQAVDYSSIAVQAGYGANGTLSFNLGQNAARNVGTFDYNSVLSISTGHQCYDFTEADVNHDGKTDLILSSGGSNTAGVVIGNGDGTFKAPQFLASLGESHGIATGDFNSDGNLDFINYGHAGVNAVHLGNGDGSFKAAYAVQAGGGYQYTAVADINRDGIIDLVSSNQGGSNVDIALGNGDGTFKTAAAVNLSHVIGRDIAVGDYNEDGFVDLAIASSGVASATLLLGNGNGTFSEAQSFGVAGWMNVNTVAGDVNNDGHLDIAVAHYAAGAFSIFLGNGNGTFKLADMGVSNGSVGGPQFGDFNSDGKLDLVVKGSGSTASVFQGNGDGTFNLANNFSSPGIGFYGFVVAGDVNGDGVSDVITDSYLNLGMNVFIAKTQKSSYEPVLTLMSQSQARQSLDYLKLQQQRITSELGSIGAAQSRLSTAVANLQVARENYDSAASRITDIDVATESAQMARSRILQQAASAVLAHANQQPALAITLLQT